MRGIIKFSFSTLVLFACSLPLVSMVLCIFFAVSLHSQDTTVTHCKVSNYLPSISAAVGSYPPELYIWRIGIGVHSFIRFAIAYAYYNFYIVLFDTYHKKIHSLIYLTTTSVCIEIISLLMITYISSSDDYDIHKLFFISFFGCSLIHMILTCYLFWQLSSMHFINKIEKSFKWKCRILISYFCLFSTSMYFFWRHNQYCETGIYSLFALFEYLTVVANILFHGTACIDFQDSIVEVPIISTSSYLNGKMDSWS